MKKYINLLTKKKDYQKKEKIFFLLRKISIFFSFLVLVLLLATFLFEQKLKNQYQQLLSKKETLLTQLLSKKELEKKVVYLNNKGAIFDKILTQDVNFLPYYKILVDYFPISSDSATIESVTFNNKKETELVLNFFNYQDLYDSLSHLEDEKFLSLFEELYLDWLNLTEEKTRNYQLTLKGKFKPIKDVN